MLSQELKDKVGQMILAGFPSQVMDEQAENLLKDFHIGNYIYFARNMKSARQVAQLSRTLGEKVYETLGVWPLIAADQEGGGVSRLTEGAALIPGASASASASLAISTSSEEKEGLERIEKLGENMGRILRSCGVNFDLAPDMDVNIEPQNPVIGARSYGDEPEKVADRAIAMMRGLEKGGVLACVKHFPGHGNVTADSHLGIPVNDTEKSVLMETEFLPFRKAVEAGCKAVLSAHVRYTKVDPETPGTLSEKILTNLLRDTFGYEGLALTDCMEMDAIRAAYGTGEGAVRAIEAGVDLLTISHTYEAVKEAVTHIYEALENGRLTEERIDRSYRRIMEAKKAMGLLDRQQISEEEAILTLEDPLKQQLADEISEDSVILLKGSLQSDPARTLVIAPELVSTTGAEDMHSISVNEAMQSAFGTKSLKVSISVSEEEILAAAEKVRSLAEGSHVIVGMYNGRLREGTKKLWSTLTEIGKEKHLTVTALLLGAAYDYGMVKEDADTVIATGEYTDLSVKSLIKCMQKGVFKGISPFRL